jgi:RNA polymerase sigma factor (sigma-70 family)
MQNRDIRKMSRFPILKIEIGIMEETIKLVPLTNESLANLFLAMAMKEDDRAEAEKAFNEFYNRYKDYLDTVVRKVCSSWKMYGVELAESVFQNTFITVFEKAESFIIIDDLDFKKQETRMKAWLGKIAKNEMLILLRDMKDRKDKLEYTDDFSFGFNNIDEPIAYSEDYLIAEKALSSLNERDRDILVTYLIYEDGNKKLPREEIQRLANLWNVLPDNLRQIRKRSFEKMKQFFETFKIR